MDKIKLEITQIKNCEKSSIKKYDVNVILNNIKLSHVIFNGEEVIPSSQIDSTEFDLFTCDCGAPGCAGFHSPVIQKKTNDTVKWVFPDDKSYSVSKLEYDFERIQFENEFQTLKNKMLGLEKRNTHLLTCIRDLSDYSDGQDLEGDERFEVSSIAESFEWYEKRYENQKKFDIILNKTVPHLYEKKLFFQYEEKLSEGFELKYVVCRMLNEWPNSDNSKGYFKAVKEAAKSIDAFITKNDSSNFSKIISKSYEEFIENKDSEDFFAQTLWDGLDLLVEGLVKAEDFNLGKLSLIVK